MKKPLLLLTVLLVTPAPSYSSETTSCLSTYEEAKLDAYEGYNFTSVYCDSAGDEAACQEANTRGLYMELAQAKRRYDHCRMYSGRE